MRDVQSCEILDCMTDDPKPESEDLDEELLRAVRGAREGDLRAFEQLVARYQNRILADCRYLTRDENNSEDLAQEVFVKAFFGLRSFEGRSSFRHWIQKIKVYHCLNHIKKRANKDDVSIDEEAVESNEQLHVPAAVQHKMESEGRKMRVEDALNALPPTLRIPLIMCDMDDLSYEEIAIALGIGLSAVKMRIKRGRERFKSVYSGDAMPVEQTQHDSAR